MSKEYEWTLEQFQKRLDNFPRVIRQHQKLSDQIGTGRVTALNPDHPEWPRKIVNTQDMVRTLIPKLQERYEALINTYPQTFQREIDRRQANIENRQTLLSNYQTLVDEGRLPQSGYNLHETRLEKLKTELDELKDRREANSSIALDETQKTATLFEWDILIKTAQINEFVWPALVKFTQNSGQELNSNQVKITLSSGNQIIEVPSDEIIKRLRQDLERNPNNPRILITKRLGRTNFYTFNSNVKILQGEQIEEDNLSSETETSHYDPVLEARHLALEIFLDEPDVNVAELIHILKLSGNFSSLTQQLRSALSKAAGFLKSNIEKGTASEEETQTWEKIKGQSSETDQSKILKDFRGKLRIWTEGKTTQEVTEQVNDLRRNLRQSEPETQIVSKDEDISRSAIFVHLEKIDGTSRKSFTIGHLRKLLSVPPSFVFYHLAERHVTYTFTERGAASHPVFSRQEAVKLMYLAKSNNLRSIKKLDDIIVEEIEKFDNQKDNPADNPT